MTHIVVNVTAPLIERATQRDSRHCMIAEAIQAEHPHFKAITVDLSTIRWTNPRTRKRYIALTPEPAAAALVEFDQGRAVAPFAFGVETIQSTPVLQATETMAEARAAGRSAPRRANNQGKRELHISKQGRARITGGKPILEGHLIGSAAPRTPRDVADTEARERKRADAAAEARTAPEGASNVTRSKSRYRQYGLRTLKP